jgi:hypothetical protein
MLLRSLRASNRMAHHDVRQNMKQAPYLLLIAMLLAGCTSNDFRAVGDLRVGLPRSQARAEIEKYEFKQKEAEVVKPASGWPVEGKGYLDVALRAGVAEKKIKKEIFSAEAYPVTHGFLGYGWIYLFYDKDGVLIDYYRLQIN